MIVDQLKAANIQALRDKDDVARSIYSVLLNKAKLVEISKREKAETFDDGDLVSVLQKTIKELLEEKSNYEKVANQIEANKIARQIDIVTSYLPQMLSEKEIYDIILKLSDKSVPNVMRTFKANYDKKCDMTLVREVLGKFN